MASSIVTVRRQRKAKTAIQGTTAAKDIVPNKPKLPQLASGSVHEEEALYISHLPENGSVYKLNSLPSTLHWPKVSSLFLSSPLIEGKGIVSAELPPVSADLRPSQPLVNIVKKNMQFT